MASFSRRSQSAQLNGSRMSHSLAPRSAANATPKDDPLQPLRAMADRVGKEVEKFAERVDHWHAHNNEDDKANYQNTLRMVGKFRDVADSTVKELKSQSGAANKGELNKSVRKRIQRMVDTKKLSAESDLGSSFQSVLPSIESSSAPDASEVHELRQWQAELATWELVRIIIDHYHPQPGTNVAAEKRARLAQVGGAYRYSPNIEIWNRFLLEDDQAKEKEVILRWLQQTAKNTESDIDSIIEQLEEASGKSMDSWTSGWLDTKSRLKQEKRTRMRAAEGPLDADYFGLKNENGTPDLVTHLDPDAQWRQKRCLEKSDEDYERALWMVCYEMLRRGASWEEISEWCRERNEAWRGVSLGAASKSETVGGPNVAGPTVGFLFRRTCFYAARGAQIPYEGAAYGLLCGDQKFVELVSRSWEDHLYARYNALLLSRFDGYLLQNHKHRVPQTWAQKFTFQDAVANIGFTNWKTSNSHVIDLLKQQKATSAQALSPMKLIQGGLISRTIDQLIFNVGVAIYNMLKDDGRPTNLVLDPASPFHRSSSTTSEPKRTITVEEYYQTLASDPHALRILVHISIVLRQGLGLYNPEDEAKWAAYDNTLVAYIELLRITHQIQLIPLYAAQLDANRQVHCLARVLPDIKNSDEQKRVIALMRQYNIDPVAVVTQNFTQIAERDFAAEDAKHISRFEMLEPVSSDEYIWPTQRIKGQFSGSDIDAKEEELIQSLAWYIHLEEDIDQTFANLKSGMLYLLLNGRLGAAEKLVQEMNIETLSLIKTEAYCGYAFDFTIPGSEEQDEVEATRSARKALSSSGRTSLLPSDIPNAHDHARFVLALRSSAQSYYEMQQLVRLIVLFHEWREEEDRLIVAQKETHVMKSDLDRIKEIFEAIQTTLEPLLESFLPEPPGAQNPDEWALKKAFFPDIILGYISIIQAFSFFTHRDAALNAMELATVVAAEENEWLQNVFLETGRMTELVDALAMVSKAMLRLGEHDDKKRVGAKKRVNKGENLKIWDLKSKSRIV